jgi:hypothetical protein
MPARFKNRQSKYICTDIFLKNHVSVNHVFLLSFFVNRTASENTWFLLVAHLQKTASRDARFPLAVWLNKFSGKCDSTCEFLKPTVSRDGNGSGMEQKPTYDRTHEVYLSPFTITPAGAIPNPHLNPSRSSVFWVTRGFHSVYTSEQ